MKVFILNRYLYDVEKTLGILQVEGVYACDTLELPWKEDSHDISCIPEGRYIISKYTSPKRQDICILLRGDLIKDRPGIEIHSANFVYQLLGCIAPGIKSEDSVVHSKDKLAILLKLLGTETAYLDIKRI